LEISLDGGVNAGVSCRLELDSSVDSGLVLIYILEAIMSENNANMPSLFGGRMRVFSNRNSNLTQK